MRNVSLLRRIEKLERVIAPQFRPEPRVRYNPRTGEYIDPVSRRPFVPEPYFPTIESWEEYHLEHRAALMRHMPERNIQ